MIEDTLDICSVGRDIDISRLCIIRSFGLVSLDRRNQSFVRRTCALWFDDVVLLKLCRDVA